MPAETGPHERTWMAWPSTGYTLGESDAEADEARRTWAAVAHAIAAFEPVSMVVDPAAVATARDWLGADVELHEAPLDDAWMRDIGPTFVLGDDGRLGAVDWVFNGWGAQAWASWERDAAVGRTVASWAGAEALPSALVNEGGGIHVDGQGTVLLTETVQLDPQRNPGWGRADVEAELERTIGATHTVWLPRGLTRDYDTFGTRGHVDMLACFAAVGKALLHSQRNPAHPDFEVTRVAAEVLASSTDAAGRRLEVVELPAPERLEDEGGPVDHSYVNHLVVNGGVIACMFDDPHDTEAQELLAHAYPGREVVGVDARPLFDRGGGIHCVTQQQPVGQ
jgi:agmatine deiminase